MEEGSRRMSNEMCCLPRPSEGMQPAYTLILAQWDLFWTSPELLEDNGTPLQYSCLENSMDGGAWWAAAHRGC